MNLLIPGWKVVAVILGLLVLGAGAFYVTNFQKANEIPFDFGDAPDGKANGFFPSLFKSNGARAKKTDEIWLGKLVTQETDSKQVDLDEADDGLNLSPKPCQTSKAYFFVHLKNPGKTEGTAYLNLWGDFNKDGKWQGADECASEWAVRNFPVDLSKQNQEIALYEAEFTAGKNTHELWYRGTVSLNQQMTEPSTGEFESGEVEDFNFEEPWDYRYYGFFCKPYPLNIKHGEKGDIEILPVLFSEPVNKVEFAQNFNPANEKRKVAINNNVVTYQSLDIDPPKRSDKHLVPLKVSFGAGGTEAILDGSCEVQVEHDEITIKTPSRQNLPRRQLPGKTVETGNPTPTPTPSPTPAETEQHPQEKAPSNSDLTPGLMNL